MNDPEQQDYSGPFYRERSSQRLVIFTPKDEEDFSSIIRAAWPNIQFTSFGERGDTDRLRDEVWIEDAWDWLIPYPSYSSFAAETPSVLAWFKPEEWKPDWRHYRVGAPKPLDTDVRYRVVNFPAGHFVYRRMWGQPTWNMLNGELWSIWRASDVEHGRRVAKLWRLLAKFAVNTYDAIYDDTGRVKRSSIRTGYWVGPDALSWCAADPSRRFGGLFRPQGSIGHPIPEKDWREDLCEYPG